jgi:hypothetical protein
MNGALDAVLPGRLPEVLVKSDLFRGRKMGRNRPLAFPIDQATPADLKGDRHASIRTTMGYVHLAHDDLATLVESPRTAKAGEKVG